VLLIDNAVTAEVLRMPDVVRVLDRAYRELADGTTICRPRIDLRYPVGDGEQAYQFGTMEGGSAASGYHAIRMKSDVLTEVEYGGTRTQEKHCVEPGRYCGLVLLLSTRTGEPLAMLHDGVLQHMRVGADSAIGTDLAARADARARERFDVWLRLGTVPAPLQDPTWRPTDEYLAYRAAPSDPVWDLHRHGAGRKPPSGDGGPRVVTFEEVLRGAPVRTSPEEITFSERGNVQGAQFFAVAGLVYELARERGLGRELPTEWFLQDIRD
jgi:ornithine cyclodeaminase/alanine dehydrogenase-like protein (mu-crystallin family)